MRLSHNMFSEGIYKNYKRTLVKNSNAMNNISTGKKLNSAKDNPNKIAQAENLKINLLSRDAASQNIQDTNSMLQTFDGALQEMNNNISRLKQLTVQAANGTNEPEDRAVIQKEIDKIKEDMNYIANNTSFNGIVMSDSTATATTPNNKQSTIGALPDEKVDIPIYNLTNIATGIDQIDVNDPTKLNSNLKWVDDAGNTISSIRSKYGAIQSRLDNTLDDISGMNGPLTSALSSIEDADIAQESLEFSRTQIIYQASISLMAQSNKLPQDALNVLASIR
ncbi:flagellin [Clostridium beijerinckii]|uniref:Flagellin n=1 Tax=Clostridium beijerinckii TaxID=1520 RepID=A0AAW3W703_CLOBE|nr:flagellin [Clostridium beijerinckii]MBC2455895.1 flagellin [Clostridium beijerinckii]MBC2474700.1 flagellin [Clostridium beijerinckii]MDG5852882.1 flagellin [Clostridium beijerinckii]NOV61850.1 flagellin [Clostridium beijerinckii]NOV68654.1 flagellin [Clostridium beijerinckii]